MTHDEFERLGKRKQRVILRQIRYNFSYEAVPKDDTGFLNREATDQVELFNNLWPRRKDPKVRYFLRKYTINNLRWLKDRR